MTKLMRVNMSELRVNVEEMLKDYQRLGGRGLTSTIVTQEVPPTCHALGERNKLVVAPGMLSGTTAACNSRLSIGTKSPLTGGIKESNVGGTPSYKLGRLGIGAIVVEGKAKDGKWYLLHVTKEGGKLIPADEYTGLKNYDLAKRLQSKFGEKVGILSIGPAGEMRLSAASVAATDTSGYPCRHAARGGPGAVMGSKGLKAVVIDDVGASGVPVADPEGFRGATKRYGKLVQDHPMTGMLKTLGTAGGVALSNEAGTLSSRNFRQGTFEGVDKISGEYMYEVITKRGGDPSHAGCTTCIIQCSNVYVDEKKEYVTSALEFETIWAQGANLGVSDLDSIAKADRLCDDYGLDTIEIGGAIAVAMEAGIKSFGDAKGALELIEEIGKGTPLGRILGNGSWVTGKVFGVPRVPAVKKQSMPAWEPRGLHGMGVVFATSTMGADHTAGWGTLDQLSGMGKLHPHRAEGQVDAMRRGQALIAAMDSTGLCGMVNMMVLDNPEGEGALGQMMSAFYGVPMTFDEVFDMGKRILKIEHEFNLAAGLTKLDDRLPEFFKEERIPPHNVNFTVSDDDLDRFFEF